MAQSPVQMRSLFVGNIPKDLEQPEVTLANLFGKFGLVLSVKLCRDVNTQKSLGHAYVNFQNVVDAERAQQQLNYSELPTHAGRELRVAFSERDPNVRARGKALFVKNLDTTMTNKQLSEIFSAYGNIIDCSQATDNTGKKLGFGTVQFAEDADADKALAALNGKVINGKELSVAVKEREEDKTFTKIFVRGIKGDATDDEIRVALGAHAKPVNAVASLVVNVNPTNGTRSAIIDLGDHDAAVAAVAALNEKKHDTLSAGDAVLTVSAYRKPAERRTFTASILQNDGRNLYVKHLPDSMTEEDLKQLFGSVGEIESVSLSMTEDHIFRGFAFVCYKSRADADKAVAHFNGFMYLGRPLYVAHAQHQDQRQIIMSERTRQMHSGIPPHMGGGAGPNGMMPPHMGGFPNPMMMNPMMMGGHPRGGMAGGPFGPMGGFGGPRGHHGMPPMMGMNPRGPFPNGPMMGHGGPRGPFQNGGGRGMGFNGHRGMNNGRGGPRMYNNNGQQQQQPQQQNNQTISMAQLQGKSTDEQKNLLGEHLYNGVTKIDADRAAKITGMLLELPTEEVLAAINDASVLAAKVSEAQNILAQHA